MSTTPEDRTSRGRYAGVPFTDADDAIAAALAEVSVPTLLPVRAPDWSDFVVG